MPDLFANLGINIPALIHQNLSASLYPASITRKTAGARDPSNIAGGRNPTVLTVSGRGFADEWNDYAQAQSLVQKGDRKIVLVVNSFPNGTPRPVVDSEITVEDNNGVATTYRVASESPKGISQDPSGATWILNGTPK